MGVRSKYLKNRLGDPKVFQDVSKVRADYAQKMSAKLEGYIDDIRKKRSKKFRPLRDASMIMRERHRDSRKQLSQAHETRAHEEKMQRSARLPKGLRGLVFRITGKYRKLREQNHEETLQCETRDKLEKQALIDKQLGERLKLQDKINDVRQEHNETMLSMRKDIAHYMDMKEKNPKLEIEIAPQPQPSFTRDFGG